MGSLAVRGGGPYTKSIRSLSSGERILLYPAVSEKVSFEAMLQGHQILVRTINLDQARVGIQADLLDLLS
jgi:hypothetical protein